MGVEPFPRQWAAREVVESATLVVLLISSLVIIYQFWQVHKDYGAVKGRLSIVSTSATSIVEEQFKVWDLSASEAQVATYILKGMSNQEIADITGKKLGTVKSQCNAVFKKSGLKSRSQLNSYFFEFLILEGAPANSPTS